MELRLLLFFVLSLLEIVAGNFTEPLQTYTPRISGISATKLIKYEGNSVLLVFSGSIDEGSYTSNMMIYDYYTIQYSSTYDFPADRSYYGMVSSTYDNSGYIMSCAIIFGGIGQKGIFDDFWLYEIDYDYWYKLDIVLYYSAYDFAYTSYYDYKTNSTKIVIVGGIDNMNNYLTEPYEY
jgi:hypothetical protein